MNYDSLKEVFTPQLIYCYDPMCSWCWGFKDTWEELKQKLVPVIEAGELVIRPLLGGLAIDSADPMPIEMQAMLKSTWQCIESQLGTQFNYNFWHGCQPRRSTYPACRACLAARGEGLEMEMNELIQQAYYLEAKNPSDISTLAECAGKIGMQSDRFIPIMENIKESEKLEQEVQLTRQMGLTSFPSLAVLHRGKLSHIAIDYQNSDSMKIEINRAILALSL